jgi:hypothetical protein
MSRSVTWRAAVAVDGEEHVVDFRARLIGVDTSRFGSRCGTA